jgi:hypothetical protein
VRYVCHESMQEICAVALKFKFLQKLSYTMYMLILGPPISVDALKHELRSLECWDRMFESHSRHGICVCVYSVFVLACV